MKKKTVLLALMLAGVMGLSGCKAWDVVCDVLAVGTTKVEKDNGTMTVQIWKRQTAKRLPEMTKKRTTRKRMIPKRVAQKTARRTVTRRIKRG